MVDDVVEDGATSFEVRVVAVLEGREVLDLDVVEKAVNAGEEDGDLLFGRERLELRLLEQLGQARTAVELMLRDRSRSEPNCEKAASWRLCARSSFIGEPTCLVALTAAEKPTRETERPTLTAGRTPS